MTHRDKTAVRMFLDDLAAWVIAVLAVIGTAVLVTRIAERSVEGLLSQVTLVVVAPAFSEISLTAVLVVHFRLLQAISPRWLRAENVVPFALLGGLAAAELVLEGLKGSVLFAEHARRINAYQGVLLFINLVPIVALSLRRRRPGGC